MEKSKIRSKVNNVYLGEYLLFAAIIIIASLIVCTNLFHYCYKMNSDIASEAVLARLIWESGEWIPKSWYPSSELRIWQAPNLAALFYGMTSNIILSMGAVCIVMTIGILSSAYFFISQFSFQKTQKLSFLLLCLILPNHFVILELLYLFGAYYAVHVIVMFITLGIYARLIGERPSHGLWFGITVLMSFMIGMQGVREILILNGPLLATEILRQLYLVYTGEWKNKKSLLVCIWCMLLLIAGFAGTLLPFSIGQSTTRNIRRGFAKLLENVLPHVAECLGLEEIQPVGKVLISVLFIIGIISLILCTIQIFKKQASDHTIWIYLMLWISPVTTMIIVAFTTTESSQRYYFMILITLAFGFIYFIKYVKEKSLIIKITEFTLILLLFLFQVSTIYLPIMRSEEPVHDANYEVCKYLEDSGYKTAYTNFENANTMTVLSGGAVRFAAVSSVEKMDICKWLSSTEWYVPNVPYQSKTAYVVTETEQEDFEKFCEQHREDIQFSKQIDRYYIYVSDYNFSCIE